MKTYKIGETIIDESEMNADDIKQTLTDIQWLTEEFVNTSIAMIEEFINSTIRRLNELVMILEKGDETS